jgi:hypothetical protein
VAALTLALGIGANSAIFALVDATLLKPLPYAAPGRLVTIWERTDSNPRSYASPPNTITAALALAGPALRAARIDPAEALRSR